MAGAGDKPELAQGYTRPIVQPEDRIDRKALEQTLRNHLAGTGADFLGGLEDQMERAIEGSRFQRDSGRRPRGWRYGHHGRRHA
jgi:hypothetical protein